MAINSALSDSTTNGVTERATRQQSPPATSGRLTAPAGGISLSRPRHATTNVAVPS